MIRSLFILVLSMLLVGCGRMQCMPTRQKTFLALGDSYTIGESVDANERWPSQVVAQLRTAKIDVADPIIIAKTGWATDELSHAIDEAKIHGQTFDLVTLMIGVNNQYRGRDLEEFRQQFVELLHRAIAFAGNDPRRVIVVSIPDWGVTRFAEGRDRAAIASQIDAFNRVGQEEANRADARYVDVTPVTRQFPKLVAGDGLHPSPEMHAKWTELILSDARAVLSTSSK